MKMNYRLSIPSYGNAKISAIKLVRIVTGMGLKEAKILVEEGGASLAGERRPDEESLRLMAADLERTATALEEAGGVFSLSLSISAEIGNTDHDGPALIVDPPPESMFKCHKCDGGTNDMIHAGRNHFGLCHKCKLIFWAARNKFSDTGTKEEQEESFAHWEARGYTAVDGDGNPVKDDRGNRVTNDPPFDRDRFYGWRNQLALAASRGLHCNSAFASGGVKIDGTSHEDGGISWVCRFAGGSPEFRGHSANRSSSAITDLEDLLAQAGMIWWG